MVLVQNPASGECVWPSPTVSEQRHEEQANSEPAKRGLGSNATLFLVGVTRTMEYGEPIVWDDPFLRDLPVSLYRIVP